MPPLQMKQDVVSGNRPGVLLVGRYPPPYGGISVHVQRLYEALTERCDVKVYDPYSSTEKLSLAKRTSKLVLYLRLLRSGQIDVAHFHASAMRRFMLAGLPMLLLARRYGVRSVITIHGGAFVAKFRHASVVSQWLLRWLLSLCDHLVVVNQSQKHYLLTGSFIAEQKVSVIPAFLPPLVAPCSRWISTLAAWKKQQRLIICSSGYGLFYYGFHSLINAARELDEELPCAVLVCVYHHCDEAYLQCLQNSAGAMPLLITRDLDPPEFALLLDQSDLYLRCTDRDGDSVAIREALYLERPVVASDCVDRPAGVTIYAADDAVDLKRQITKVVAGLHTWDHVQDDNSDPLARLWQVYGLSH